MSIMTSLLAGLVFGVGLIVSGMANPAKVLGFLDLTGRWDPSLALVMAGAISVGLISFAVAKRTTQPFLGAEVKRSPSPPSFPRRRESRALWIPAFAGMTGLSCVVARAQRGGATEMKLPKAARDIDRRLVGGGLIFGIGWGVAGFCPGPAVVALGMGEAKAVVFVVAMLVGMGIFELLERSKPARQASAA